MAEQKTTDKPLTPKMRECLDDLIKWGGTIHGNIRHKRIAEGLVARGLVHINGQRVAVARKGYAAMGQEAPF